MPTPKPRKRGTAMNEFNYPTGSKPKTRGTRRGGARAASSSPGVEPSPGTSPPPPPPPFSNPTATNEVSSGDVSSGHVSQERAARPVSYADQYSPSNKENTMRCSNKTTTGMSLLGGASLGAALMYLLDPE